MKILIDGRVLSHKKSTGVENYTKAIINNLSNDINYTIAKPYFKNKYYGHLWQHFILPFKSLKYDLLFCPANTAPIFLPSKIKLIMTLHDVSFLVFKDTFSKFFRLYYSFLVPLNLKRANKIITVSNYSKEEITRFFPDQKDKIEVIYNGINPIFKENKSVDKKHQILYVGSLNKRKNFNNLIKAFLILNTNIKYKNLKLIIVGNFSDNFKIDSTTNNLLQKAKHNKNIEFLENIEDYELVKLYQSSKVFVYPSFYEGFGLPILESFSSSTSVITSNNSSLKEVAQDAAIYCDPYDVVDIKNKIEYLINNNALQDSLEKKGKIQSSKFNWKVSSSKHVELFKKVVSEA